LQYKKTFFANGVQDCSKTQLDDFRTIFGNLKFSVKESENTFEFRDGPLIAPSSGSLVERWTLGDNLYQQNVPLTYQRIVNTGQAGKTSDDTEITFLYLHFVKQAEPFFRIPHGC